MGVSQSRNKAITFPINTRLPFPLPTDPIFAFLEKPWYHNLSREQATFVLEQRKIDGYFIIRPSTNKNQICSMILSLWFKDKVYNIPIRKKSDERYALGIPKDNEDTFDSIENIVAYYKSHTLGLCSNDNYSEFAEDGTVLTGTPSKNVHYFVDKDKTLKISS